MIEVTCCLKKSEKQHLDNQKPAQGREEGLREEREAQRWRDND
jgi:hypothetical protein